jgi:hypothetical protein
LYKARLVLLSIALTATAVLTGCSSIGHAVIDQVAQLGGTSEEEGVFRDAGNTEFEELAVGMCIADDVNLTIRFLSFSSVGCGEPHTAEVYAVFDVAEPGTAFPGDETVDTAAWAGCETRFEPYVGRDYASSELDVAYWVPDGASFERDDRSVICMAHSYDAESLTASVEGSRL